ncbi:MAG: hypothetical protein IPL77_03385 [Flavobacteriales bacterium]|nr:hypothetical protein [Flavobacteriales bacterium]
MEHTSVNSVLSLANGQVLISGLLSFPLIGEERIARLNANGTRDTSFPLNVPGGTKLTEWSGRIYTGRDGVVSRIMPDGQTDPDWDEMYDSPYFAALQGGDYHVFSDGRVLVSGGHILSDSIRGFEGYYNLVWFSNTGYLDTTRTHRTSDGVIYEIEEQPDGKFLCSGVLTEYEGTAVGRIFRVHPDGALDASFQTDFVWGEANDFHTLADGRILAGGYLRRNGQQDSLCVVRLLPNGDVDPTFHLATFDASWTNNFAPYVLDVHPLADGRILIAGVLDHVEGEIRGGIAMLGEDGVLLDDAFTGEGCGGFLYQGLYRRAIVGIVPAPDGSYYIHGAYHGYDDGTTNDTTQRLVSRLHGLDVGVAEQEATAKPLLSLSPNPAATCVNIAYDLVTAPHGAGIVINETTGRQIWSSKLANTQGQIVVDTRAFVPGVYSVQLSNGGELLSTELLVVKP